MRLTDYEVNKDAFRYANNKMIDELKLKNEFYNKINIGIYTNRK